MSNEQNIEQNLMSNGLPQIGAMHGQKAAAEAQKRRRARLWEDTIVLALRDVQWRAAWSKRNATQSHEPEPCIPKGILKMDGTAESHLGDVALKADDHRFFLIEVKSTKERIKDEWWDGYFKPKKLYERLASTVDAAKCQKDTGGLETAMLELSLRGHWVAFWHPELLTGTVRAGLIEMQPYLQAVIDSRDAQSFVPEGVITDLSIPYVHSYLPDDPTNLRYYMEVLDLDVDRFLVGYINPETTNATRHAIGSLGLNHEEFQAYVNYLTGGRVEDPENQTGEPINAVVQTVRDGFFQMVTNTTDLANILEPGYTFTPELEERLKKLHAREERKAAVVAETGRVVRRRRP